eukprot:CAMPEP_0182452124 /NCGR_PEP_ID=MMETSP1172-20130603/44084_1 /TAXON_ID=708627 /ORGANISM="Timspurckia oligopyrenoides, Strain CCMP3278" /LENGTH=723 /DNA_ID=CAMNT_0024649941 /DNA_START=1 /DNA_END=2172 /DNA_ORIENTATION=-
MYYFQYRLASNSGFEGEYIPVATTRPETILGDTALCVHPEDERFQKYIGKNVVVPILGREIPVIADDYVDREFGTGAVKITPAHDPNDYEIGKRHDLASINIMNADASINANGGAEFEGLDRFDCRKTLWSRMEAEGLVIKEEDHVNRVPRSQRGGEIIEPRLSTQWFVKMQSLADPALDAVRNGEVRFVPERFEKVYYNWLENIHDWCISRQLWWGHRVPVWYVVEHPGEYIVARNEEEALQKAHEKYGNSTITLEQDPDVLDTWFSSGLWPFATLGWPKQTKDLEQFYPNVVMETGYDILFFWVARMIMMGIEFTGKPPFSIVYMHGLVRDGNGKKMSKTLGNVIDPLDMISDFGTDALRYTLVTGSTPGQDIPLSTEKVETNRNFANKLWNSGRYLIGNLKNCDEQEMKSLAALRASDFGTSQESVDSLLLPERYILSKLNLLIRSVSESLDEYSFGESGRQIYEFLWDEFADWYIEISKTRLNGDDLERKNDARKTLVFVLDSCLRLLHPFMPFITEAIWQRLPHDPVAEPALITASWPSNTGFVDEPALRAFGRLQALVRSIRNVRAEYQVEPAKRIAATVVTLSEHEANTIHTEAGMLNLLARIDINALNVRVQNDLEADDLTSDKYVQLVVADGLSVYLPLRELIDAEKECARLTKQLVKMEKDFEGLSRRMNAPGFADKAPPVVVTQTQQKAEELKERIAAVNIRLQQVTEMAKS